MVSECANPKCRKPLIYLNNGRVVRIVHEPDSAIEIEHYRLCGNCFSAYDLCVSAAGIVSCVRRKSPPAHSPRSAVTSQHNK